MNVSPCTFPLYYTACRPAVSLAHTGARAHGHTLTFFLFHSRSSPRTRLAPKSRVHENRPSAVDRRYDNTITYTHAVCVFDKRATRNSVPSPAVRGTHTGTSRIIKTGRRRRVCDGNEAPGRVRRSSRAHVRDADNRNNTSGRIKTPGQPFSFLLF